VGRMTNLREVNLSGAMVTGAGLANLRSLQRLEQLSLPSSIAADDLIHLQAFNLKSFSFPQRSGDKELGYFAHMTNLQTVWTPTEMTDEGVKILAKLPELETLFMVGSTQVTGAGLAPLAALPKLQRIHLPQQIDDAGVRALSSFKSIRDLGLFDTRISDQALAHLAAMPGLQSVDLPEGITDAGIVHLQEIPGLKRVGFRRSAITAQGIAKLKSCRGLESINLIEVKLTDADIAALAQFTGIKQLMIQQFKLTTEQLQTLKQALPNCDVGNW